MKLMRQFTMLLAAAAMFLTAVAAQESTEKKPAEKPAHKAAKKEAAKPEAAMPMPKPSAEMDKLAKMLVGSWNTSEKFEVSEMMPKGGAGSGTAVVKRGPGGLSLVEEYRSHGGMGAFSGHGVIWWDDKAQGYKSIWCDNMSPTGCTVSNGLGKWEGNDVVFNDEQEMMGKKMAMKEVYTDATPSSFTMTMDSSMDGGAMKRVMSIKHTRAGANSAAAAPGAGNN